MDDIDFSLPASELDKYVDGTLGRYARKLDEGRDPVSFSALVSLRRNRAGAAVPPV
jgi:hypothetical protein